ncbi:MAG TPA: hypothetical protein VF525_10870 [Pyrinomonadaceae bacterium]|jgi:hypothetical protein
MAYDEHGTLEIEQDLPYQERAWRRQRIWWVLLTLLLIAALLGVFGTGVLSRAEAGARSAPVWLEYERFARAQAETNTLRFHLAPAAATNGQVRLWLSRAYLEHVQVLSVTPEPATVETAPDRFIYIFPAPALNAPTAVTFQLEPERLGRLHGQAGLDGSGTGLEFKQLVYP